MTDKEYAFDLFWHCLNYRAAPPEWAQQYWEEVEACMERLIAREREECAMIVETEWINIAERMYGKDVAELIRNRGNE